MKILVLTQYFWPEDFRINDLVRALVEAGLELTVLTGKPNYPDGRIFPGYAVAGIQSERYAGAEVVRVPIAPRGKNSPLRLVLNYLSFVLAGYMLAPYALRGRHFDAVFVYAPSPLLQALPAIFLAWLKRAPLIVWVQDLWPESLSATGFVRHRLVLMAIETLVRFIYRHADSILIQSEAFRIPISRLVQNTNKIHFYPNSAEAIFCVPSDGDDSKGMASVIRESFSVVFAGNLGTAQSLETIVGAAERLKYYSDIRFYLVGGGSREAWLMGEIERRKLNNLLLTGRLPLMDMPSVLAAASALLVTLKDEPIFSYTIPSKVQAYLAVGRPIIAALNGEGARIVEKAGAGITCPAEDAAALADAILNMHSLTLEERARMGENGRHYFMKHFELKRLVRELIDHFELTRRKFEEKTG